MPIRKIKQDISPKKKTLSDKAEEYQSLQKEVKKLTSKLETLKAEMKQLLTDKGYETPQGNMIMSVATSKGAVQLTNTLRSTTFLKANAVEIIKTKLPELTKRLIEKVEVLREDRLKSLIEDGTIPVRTARQIYGTSDNYAFSIKEDKEVEE